MRRNRIIFCISSVISVFIAVIIFMFSAQNGEASGGVSEGFTRNLLSSAISDELVYAVEGIIRKVAHYAIYFALGVSVYISFYSYMRGFVGRQPGRSHGILVPTLICFIYSLTDELHQCFVSGRRGAFSDCLLDTFGSLSGILLMTVIMFLFLRCERK